MTSFHLPVRIITGDGCFSHLGEVAASLGRRALVVCGASARRSGTLARAQEMLASGGVESAAFDGVSGEPTLACVEEAMEAARASSASLVVGLGGGSAIDVAKATSGLAPLEGGPRDYFAGREIDGAPLPWIAMPTTSGTGAEVTMNAVLIDETSGAKQSIRSEAWFARAALVDPELTLSMPPQITAHSGADALCQAIETFVSLGAMPITDALCREAIRLTGRSLLPAYLDGQDIQARRDMHYGSLMAGMALANARLGAVHGIAHPLGGHYRLPHGLVCGLLLPYVMEWNLPVATERYAEVGELMGLAVDRRQLEAAARATVEGIQRLMGDIGIPEKLSQAGIGAIDYSVVARESMSSSMKHNPRPMSEEDVQALLRRAM